MSIIHKGSIYIGVIQLSLLKPKGLYNTLPDNDIHFIQSGKESKALSHIKIDFRNKYGIHSGTA